MADDMYQAAESALGNQDWKAALAVADQIREWCRSDDAKHYDGSSVQMFLSYANLINMNHGHKVLVGE
jgi:hypothetical protein